MRHYQDDEFEVIAHMSPDEVRELDALQGGRHIDKHTNLPTYRPLAYVMHHDSVRPLIDDWERNKYAGGGEVNGINQHLRNMGRYGDTEVVKLPRALAELFDRALNDGRPSINPHTGKREYFLGGLLGGLGKIFSPVTSLISNAMPGIGKFLPGLAEKGLSTLGSIAQQGFNDVSSGNFNPANFAKNAFSTAVGNFAPIAGQMAQQGLSALGTEAGSPQLGEMAGQFANNMLTNVAPQAANAFAQGSQMPNFGRSAAEQMGNAIQSSQMGQNPYAAGFGQAMQGYGAGMTPQDAAYRGMSYAGQNTPNQLIGAALQGGANAMQQYRAGASPFQAAMSGVRSLSPEMQQGAMNQAMNYGRQGFQSFRDRFAPQYNTQVG